MCLHAVLVATSQAGNKTHILPNKQVQHLESCNPAGRYHHSSACTHTRRPGPTALHHLNPSMLSSTYWPKRACVHLNRTP